jgi:hypothetical protein
MVDREDVRDDDFVDAVELASDGTASYKTAPVTSVVSGTITVNPSADYLGLVFGDDPIEVGDIFVLTGATAGNGTYTVAAVTDNTQFTVVEAIVDSTGGSADFRHPAGALKVGVDPTSLSFTTESNLQAALEDLGAGSGITPGQHRNIDQLVHDIAEDAYTEITKVGGVTTNVTIWTDNGKTIKIRESQITRTAGKVSQTVDIQYDAAGAVIVGETLTKTYNRTGGQVTSIDEVLT